MVISENGHFMKLEKVVMLASLPLTVVGLIASFMTLVAGAGHGDKSLVLFIFPLPAFAWALGGFVLGIVAAAYNFLFTRWLFMPHQNVAWDGWLQAQSCWLISALSYFSYTQVDTSACDVETTRAAKQQIISAPWNNALAADSPVSGLFGKLRGRAAQAQR
jgi:hypothetical protein